MMCDIQLGAACAGSAFNMAAPVKIQVQIPGRESDGGGRRQCDQVLFDPVPRDVVLGDEIVVWYRVSAHGHYRPKSGDWIGLFECSDDDDDEDDNCCVRGSYSYVSFQWAPKYPNIEKSIPRRRVVFNSDLTKVTDRPTGLKPGFHFFDLL